MCGHGWRLDHVTARIRQLHRRLVAAACGGKICGTAGAAPLQQAGNGHSGFPISSVYLAIAAPDIRLDASTLHLLQNGCASSVVDSALVFRFQLHGGDATDGAFIDSNET